MTQSLMKSIPMVVFDKSMPYGLNMDKFKQFINEFQAS
jgi:hypothetical protein